MTPSCYGQYWEGIADSDCVKGGCSAIQECLAKFATTKLVEYQEELGAEATPEKLSALASVCPEAILLAINFQKTNPMLVEAPTVSEELTTDVEPPVATDPVAEPDPPESTKAAKPVESPSEDSAEGELDTPDPETPKKKAPPKVVPKKKAAPKKKSVSKKKAPAKPKPVNPPIAESVKGATDSANIKTRTKSVSRVSAPGGKIRVWDPKHNASRWRRERERSPLIARLTPGMKLHRLWKGVRTLTEVRKGYYLYDGNQYPTLYSVMETITGTRSAPKQVRKDGTRPTGTRQLASWNALRFFKLDKLFGIPKRRDKKKKKRPKAKSKR